MKCSAAQPANQRGAQCSALAEKSASIPPDKAKHAKGLDVQAHNAITQAHNVKIPREIWKKLPQLGLILMMGMSLSACEKSMFTWKEEILLHDGTKLIAERSDIFDSSMNHEIGQGASLAEHKTVFKIPGSNQTVIWKSDNRSLSDPDYLDLLTLDILDGVPYVATTTGRCHTYNKWQRPNPPYIVFKYVGEWKLITLEEFPEQFKVNIIVNSYDFNEIDKQKVSEESHKYGFIRAETVAKFMREIGKDRIYYSIFRTSVKNVSEASVLGCDKFE
jgi:hypothetical protein